MSIGVRNDAVMRNRLADYLKVDDSQETYILLGSGVNTLDENPAAQTESKIYVCDATQTSYIKSYQTQFSFDTDMLKNQEAIMALYDVGRNHKTGGDAEAYYVRAELFQPIKDKENTFAARRFRVSIEVSGINGSGGEIVKVTGNLNCMGDFTDGEFNTVTKTFTAFGDATPPEEVLLDKDTI